MNIKFKKIWKDSVGSKLITEIIKWIWIAWVFPILIIIWNLLRALVGKIDFQSVWTEVVTMVKQIFNWTININIWILIVVITSYFILTLIVKRWLFSRLPNKIKKYNTDSFWNAIIKWKWEKKDGKLRVKYDDFELICPNNQHNLVHDQNDGHYFLKCNQCGFISESYHYEAPSNVVIIAPMADHYFYTALTSKIDAELRHRGLK